MQKPILAGKYEVLGVLGTGGMATVYRGREQALKRDVAIKAMAQHLASNEDFVRRFIKEAEIIAGLQHANIIEIYAYDVGAIGPYMVMPLLTGGTLLERVKAHNILLSFREIGELARQLGSALHYAHSRGIVHRDIKFGNIMFDGGGNARVMDFGIARMHDATQLTATGSPTGTFRYMAPEQWHGSDITGAVDQYALALVLYELVTATYPFEGDTMPSLMTQHITVTPPPMQTYREDSPATLDAVIARALSKEAGERYPDMRAFTDAFVDACDAVGDKSTGFFAIEIAPPTHEPLSETTACKFTTNANAESAVDNQEPVFQTAAPQAKLPPNANASGNTNWVVPAIVIVVIAVFFGIFVAVGGLDLNVEIALDGTGTASALVVAQVAEVTPEVTPEASETATLTPTHTATSTATATDTPTLTFTPSTTPTATEDFVATSAANLNLTETRVAALIATSEQQAIDLQATETEQVIINTAEAREASIRATELQLTAIVATSDAESTSMAATDIAGERTATAVVRSANRAATSTARAISRLPMATPTPLPVPDPIAEAREEVLIIDFDDDDVRIRETPGLDEDDFTFVPSASIGFVVSDNPVVVDNMNWYEVIVLTTEISGWVEEPMIRTYEETISSQLERRCPGARNYDFEIGQRFIVPVGDGATFIWTDPNSYPRVGEVAEGDGGQIIGGPSCDRDAQQGALQTWEVRSDDGLIGWMATGYGESEIPWLVPIMDED